VIPRLIAAAAALVAGTCAPDPPPPLVYFGDSNVAMAAGRLDGTVHATAGYSIDDWAPEMADVPDGAVVVVALGSNDILEHQDAALNEVVARGLLGDVSCVVWVTVNQPSFDQLGLGAEARSFNDWLRTGPGLVPSEWSTTKTQPMPNAVHYTPSGYDDYAAKLAAAPELCP
jgi:hypothetical protein